MRSFYLLLLTAISLFASAPAPVSYVDPVRFSGLWYEIARTYNRFEEGCVAATVEYTLDEENEYRVRNRCFDGVVGGDLIEYSGSAEPTLGDSMSRIDMTYFWIFTREYRVVYLENDYSLAVVCDDAMEQVWIMSRTPTIAKNRLAPILSLLEQHMELRRLIWTPQDAKGRYQ